MRSAEGLAEISLAYGAVFNGSGELLGWVGLGSIVSKISS